MGANDFYIREIDRNSDAVARMAGVGARGSINSITDLLTVPQRAREEREAKLAAYGEYLAPMLARERGISEDEARREITGGVAPLEPGWKRIGQAFGLMDPPEGESYKTRIARLSALAHRLPEDERARGDATERLGKLIDIGRKLKNPNALQGAISTTAQRAGLGDIGQIEAEPETASNIIELMQTNPALAETYWQKFKDSRGGGAAARPTLYDKLKEDLRSPDPVVRAVARRKLGLEAGKRDRDPRVKAFMDSLAIDRDAAAGAILSPDPEVRRQGQERMAQIDQAIDEYAAKLPNGGWVDAPSDPVVDDLAAEDEASALVQEYLAEEMGGADTMEVHPGGGIVRNGMSPHQWERRTPHIRDRDPALWEALGGP